ncbi:MAG TPA: glycosyltransferase [Candidatus Hydrogenedentes bacterium]|nr:glycosyltransferase [Candidatus Hydrogenedentota bacterium]HRT19477.1 glycosyltransferase [Candidatus Hydrogenedentota bacterium]HRT63789.1 glycosyltransferase [Candidatus Hydrogenedentota bacterium]
MASSVSLVLVMKNERKNIERIFPTILSQEFDAPVEYIYVDSGSTDGTIEFMREQGVGAIVIPPEEFHHGRTRNLAARRAKNDVIVFLSGDAAPTGPRWLYNLVRHFDDPKVGAVYGRQIPPEGMGPMRRHALEHEYPAEGFVRDLAAAGSIHPGLFRFSNANSAVRRELWQRFPYNETVVLAEDQGMCRDVLMAGYRVVYDPEAAVVHGHERNLRGEFQFAFENGLSLTRMGILRNPAIGGEFGYGLRRVRDDVRHFISKGRYGCALQSLCVNAAKWIGVQLGKRGDELPRAWVRRISPKARP